MGRRYVLEIILQQRLAYTSTMAIGHKLYLKPRLQSKLNPEIRAAGVAVSNAP